MALSTDISRIFKDMNKSWASRIFTLVLIAFLAFSATQIFKAKGKSNTQCDERLAEVQSFLKFLMDDLAKDDKITAIDVANSRSMMPAIFIQPDTTPANKERIRKIDSVLNKIKSSTKKTKT